MDGTEAALQPGERLAATLSSRQKLTHDTLRLDFTFDDNSKSLGVPIGHHIILNAQVKFSSTYPFRVCISRIARGHQGATPPVVSWILVCVSSILGIHPGRPFAGREAV